MEYEKAVEKKLKAQGLSEEEVKKELAKILKKPIKKVEETPIIDEVKKPIEKEKVDSTKKEV